MAILIKTAAEIEKMRISGIALRKVHDALTPHVVHGIPSDKRVLKEGDILSIDCGVIIDGFYSDAAVTHAIGKVSPATTKLLETTQASLEAAILQCQPGG